MNVELTLPTRKDEDFRYSDIDALRTVWPVPREEIEVVAGLVESRQVIELGEGTVARHLDIRLGKGAKLDLRVLTAGPAYGRIAIDVRLAEGAGFTLGAAQIATGSETLEIVTEVTHAAPNATSRQVVRTVLAGHATGTYLGRVAVARGSDGTDAEQSVRAMLLDRTATANARPELEIYADDVKAAHGCAVGELDAMGLFYLMSRGLTPPQAKRLMLQAFIAEAFTGASGEAQLGQTALARLEAIL
ncbi:Fe-S cluster assembly protein SufD [Novosphingobium sp. CF614]|uniref:SufD family Fe-S cluster assembly protein n=1 Tax=Novosphingobium sp. CF614 TaxID=1884364 RepID=UPI0008ECEE48|nr:SufD family Fe-S cluster assembly protein [Novosphingobium sp. CF614]SFG23471.1 Fe-S cluster assembly protein SufD [Novosphingobium sp. CF614]